MKRSTKVPQQLRQGDVLLERVSALPAGAIRKPTDQGRVILAYGEVTGHAHVVETDAEIVEAFLAEMDGETYLAAPGGAQVVHEEHGTVTLPPGTYKVVRQREYSPQQIRNVAD
jgi:hypothetical protein